ncbi:MAG: acetate--CoA ligase family protein [Candidatus Bathyarchaeota archaeon]
MEKHSYYMSMALELAKLGWGRTNPNPLVGAVIVKNQRVIGKGYHKVCGGSHAEVEALNSLTEAPDSVDLCVVAVPASIVPKIAEEAGLRNVKVLAIISAGFRETGSEGAKKENEVMSICKKYGIRVLGPNCLGVIDTYTPLDASFAPATPERGNITFISQSGALGTAVLDWASEERIGFSKFISLGNRADIDETDLILAAADDENTKVILLYVEGLVKGRKFIDALQKVTLKKPVIVLKSGITEAGLRAVSSHTGSMAGSDVAFTVAFEKAGVIRVNTAEELFDSAEAFSSQPGILGSNIAIVTNAGGPGILATDACGKFGLKVAPISAEIIENLRGKLPPASGFFNPIDVLGDATAERYGFAIETVLESPDVNGVLVILTPQAMTEPDKIAKMIIEVTKKSAAKPLLVSFFGGKTVKAAIAELQKAKIPNYEFPERAVESLSALFRYSEFLKTPYDENFVRLEVDYDKVRAVFEKVKKEGRVTLKASEALEVANAYGIRTPALEFAANAEDAALSAERIGYPVVMKIESPQILHKTDIGGVKLNINSSEDAMKSFYEIIGSAHTFYPSATVLGVNVLKMVGQGREIIVGMNRDVTFGALIMVGLGGIYVNFLKDVSFGLAPLNMTEASKMVTETKAYTLLRGIRGEKASDINSVIDTVLRVSQLSSDFEEINEIDINPLFVYESGNGCLALDVKITIKL